MRTAILAALALAALALAARPARADLEELRWTTEGYLRTRSVYLTNLAPQDRVVLTHAPTGEELVIPDIRRTSYLMSRFRIMPTLSYAKLAKLQLQVDGLDDILWGDNNGLAAAPLFATDVSSQYFLGGPPQDSIQLKRAWVEFQVPVGLMRVGRMPSHWGLGLLANGGGTGNLDPTTPVGEPPRKALDHFFAEDFGDKHFGSTADRILFVTKPISIYKTITKQGDTSSNFLVGYAFDKLTEAPLLPLEPFERRFRPFGQQGFISRGGDDDVDEHVVIAAYNNPDWDQIRYTDELRVGFYGVLRSAREGSTNPSAGCGMVNGQPVPCDDTGSKVWIADLWWRVRYGPYFTEGELYKIGGDTFGGVPFPYPNLKKEADIDAGVVRAAYLQDSWDGILELGHASGDDALADGTFKQRPMHPDFNVGLILFEETLRELSARTYGPPFIRTESPNGAAGFFSNGGVINANYVNPRGRYRTPIGGLELYGGLLLAWVDTLATQGPAMFLVGNGDKTFLGTEVDLGARTTFAGKMRFAVETGYLRYGPALKAKLPNADQSFTLQTSLAFVW